MKQTKNPNIVCVDNSCTKGEYHSFSTTVWKHCKTINRANQVIRLPEWAKSLELRIYANIVTVEGEDDSLFKRNEHKLNKGHWVDIRKTNGEERGFPYCLNKNCILKLPLNCVHKKVIIYVENNTINEVENDSDNIKDSE